MLARIFRGFRPAPIRWARPLAFGLFCLAVTEAAIVFLPTVGQGISIGRDFDLYLGAARTWLETGSFYPARQLAGPYQVEFGDILYPPYLLGLLVPFTIVPAADWRILPIAVTGFIVYGWRPSLLASSGILVCVLFPNSVALLLNGNPVLWAMAAISLGTRHGWPAALAVVKPSIAPVALIWMGTRGWWIALTVLLAVSVPFADLWPDYVRVLTGAQTTHGILYSLGDLPLLMVPLVAWAGRRGGGMVAHRPKAAITVG